ncbi:MAG: hypothetical protein H7X89_05760 [Rhizobiales bacterium]|nr:hypothetical protein [Hyphomicrobiales bacterium]
MLIPKTFTEFLLSEGRPLAEINPGSDEYALKPLVALKALDLLSGSQVAVLGGDVLKDEIGKLTYTYENWYCERLPKEDPLHYVNRSQMVAREFINALVRKNNETLYVVLGFSELGIVNVQGSRD